MEQLLQKIMRMGRVPHSSRRFHRKMISSSHKVKSKSRPSLPSKSLKWRRRRISASLVGKPIDRQHLRKRPLRMEVKKSSMRKARQLQAKRLRLQLQASNNLREGASRGSSSHRLARTRASRMMSWFHSRARPPSFL